MTDKTQSTDYQFYICGLFAWSYINHIVLELKKKKKSQKWSDHVLHMYKSEREATVQCKDLSYNNEVGIIRWL